MSEKRITIRLNTEKYTHKKAYEIYKSIPHSQRSDYVRMAIIMMHDRDEQLNHIRNMLSDGSNHAIQLQNENDMDISDDMLDFITAL